MVQIEKGSPAPRQDPTRRTAARSATKIVRYPNARSSARADGPPGDCSYLTSGRYEEVRAIADAGAGTGAGSVGGPGGVVGTELRRPLQLGWPPHTARGDPAVGDGDRQVRGGQRVPCLTPGRGVLGRGVGGTSTVDSLSLALSLKRCHAQAG